MVWILLRDRTTGVRSAARHTHFIWTIVFINLWALVTRPPALAVWLTPLVRFRNDLDIGSVGRLGSGGAGVVFQLRSVGRLGSGGAGVVFQLRGLSHLLSYLGSVVVVVVRPAGVRVVAGCTCGLGQS